MEQLDNLIHEIVNLAREIDSKNRYALQVHRGLGFDYGYEYSDKWYDPDKELPSIDHYYTYVLVSDKEEPYTSYSIRGDKVWSSDEGVIISGPWESQMVEIATELKERLKVKVLEKRNAIQREKDAAAEADKQKQLAYEESVRNKWNG